MTAKTKLYFIRAIQVCTLALSFTFLWFSTDFFGDIFIFACGNFSGIKLVAWSIIYMFFSVAYGWYLGGFTMKHTLGFGKHLQRRWITDGVDDV